MPLGDVCLHEAWPIVAEATEEVADPLEGGERDIKKVPGEVFDCFYMDPGEKEIRSPVSGKKITQPTILLEAEREDGTLVVLKAEDEVDILAEEILGATPVRFQVDGGPTPLAPPGDIIGWECRLKRVRGA